MAVSFYQRQMSLYAVGSFYKDILAFLISSVLIRSAITGLSAHKAVNALDTNSARC